MERNKEKRRRTEARRLAAEDRDAQIKAVNDKFLPQIMKLKEQHRIELKKIWDSWKDTRSKAE